MLNTLKKFALFYLRSCIGRSSVCCPGRSRVADAAEGRVCELPSCHASQGLLASGVALPTAFQGRPVRGDRACTRRFLAALLSRFKAAEHLRSLEFLNWIRDP